MFGQKNDRAGKRFGDLPLFNPEDGQTVLAPEGQGSGYWVGAPSVIWDSSRGSFLLTYRRRRPREVQPDRGYVAHIAESKDGVSFHDIWTVEKSAFGSTSMEKFSLARDEDGVYRLYPSYVDPIDNRWRIDVLEAKSPDAFDPKSTRAALTAASTRTEGVKDPWVFKVGGLWHMLISYATTRSVYDLASLTEEQKAKMHATSDVYNTGVLVAPSALAVSLDGVNWTWEGEIMSVGPQGAWDGYQTRLGSLFYRSPIWVGLYDGSASVEGNYEERCGIAYSFDLRHWTRATTSGPALTSPHGSTSLRYVDVIERPGSLYFYYEYVRPDGAHELRVSIVPQA